MRAGSPGTSSQLAIVIHRRGLSHAKQRGGPSGAAGMAAASSLDDSS
jgi:hypothetical protein